jgi:DNA-binding LytR/AlgR family response regulator
VEAFNAGALDYLLKPIAADRLAQPVARLRERLQSAAAAPELGGLIEQLAAQLRQRGIHGGDGGTPRLKWVSASVGDTVKMFGVDEVVYFQSDEKYTRFVTVSDEAHVRKSLREIAEGMDPEVF